jgi:putative DNA primase/helicase
LSAGGVSGVVRLARSDPSIIAPLVALDARPYELNTPAGVVDLRTGDVQAAEPALLHTRSTSVAPDFAGSSQVFDTFLHDTFDDDTELAGYVQRLIGVSAIGSVLEQLLPFAVVLELTASRRCWKR